MKPEPDASVIADMHRAVAHAIRKDAEGHADLAALIHADFADAFRRCETNRERALCCRRWLRALQ